MLLCSPETSFDVRSARYVAKFPPDHARMVNKGGLWLDRKQVFMNQIEYYTSDIDVRPSEAACLRRPSRMRNQIAEVTDRARLEILPRMWNEISLEGITA